MKDFGIVKGSNRPQEIEITSNNVFVATNIQEYTEIIDGRETSGYKYNYVCYSKDEYILLMAQNQTDIAALREELEAAKVLLGVE